jgi:hypothetical protein
MKPRRSVTLFDDDPAISISFISGNLIRLRPSELAACELVVRICAERLAGIARI